MTNLKSILKIQSYSGQQFRMFAYIIRQISKIPNVQYYTYNGCIYVTKGNTNSYPCIVSHMDTVHPICEDLSILEYEGKLTGFNTVTMTQTGVGGDDKVGIYIALESLHHMENIKAVFFRDEEVGCLGSYEPDNDFFNDVNFVLQCDRRGNSGFVTNASGVELSSNGFQSDVKPILNKYGYSFVNGAMTDVMALRESGICISMANIECGYYNPHCDNEYVNIQDVENCKQMVLDIFDTLKKRYDVKPHKKQKYFGQKYKWDYQDYYKDLEPVEFCESCLNESETTFDLTYKANLCDYCKSDYLKTVNYDF